MVRRIAVRFIFFIDAFMYDQPLSVLGFLFILITGGAFLIAKSNRKQVNYKKILIPLGVYLVDRIGYGFDERSA